MSSKFFFFADLSMLQAQADGIIVTDFFEVAAVVVASDVANVILRLSSGLWEPA
jgi:hypothetical protein